MPLDLAPNEAWQPLSPEAWNASAARHLLRRATWTATPDETRRAVTDGLGLTLDRLFPPAPPRFPRPRAVEELQEETPEFMRTLKRASGLEKRRLAREARDRARTALIDMSIQWMQFAARPGHAAFAKWGFFLGDVYVVASAKVRHPALLWLHGDIIARHALGPAPALTKAVSRSPAMIRYLDLNQNRRGAPNENFARELLELFVLGEGRYTEHDIKEAARAFTGYRARFDTFQFAPRQHDAGPKTVFGRTGAFSGDDIIDLAYRQEAAGAFLPHELVKFYLSDTPLPPAYPAALGAWWRAQAFDLRALARRFFGSRIFFDPAFRGNFIKSPLQYYLGLSRDLDLAIAPLPRRVFNPLRQMGQTPCNPPNIRGWVGGRAWINSATLAARCQLVESLFAPINETRLNADEQRALAAARAGGSAPFSSPTATVARYAALPPAAAATSMIDEFLALPVTPQFHEALRSQLAAAPRRPPTAHGAAHPAPPAANTPRRRRRTVFQSPP
jgi:uncharacterized protein (DUF1800 family)